MNKRRRKKAVKKYLAGQPLRGHEYHAAQQELRRAWRETARSIRRIASAKVQEKAVADFAALVERMTRQFAEGLKKLIQVGGGGQR